MSKESSEPEEFFPGYEFQVVAPGYIDLDDVRRMIKEKTGFNAHIKVSFGPTEIEGSGISCPIVAVGDPYLDITLNNVPVPAQGHVLYIGYLTDAEEGAGD